MSVQQVPVTAAPLHPWVWPSKPWQHVHIDFAGTFMDQMFLLLVEAHSKRGEEVIDMAKSTSVTSGCSSTSSCSLWITE